MWQTDASVCNGASLKSLNRLAGFRACDSSVLGENASDWFPIGENVARKGNSDVERVFS